MAAPRETRSGKRPALVVLGWHTCPAPESLDGLEDHEAVLLVSSAILELLSRWGPCPREHILEWSRWCMDLGTRYARMEDAAAAYTWNSNAQRWIEPFVQRSPEHFQLWEEANARLAQR